jgi:ATP-dependent DNA helicase RecG
LGSFIPGSVRNVIDNNAPEEHYRNKFLAMAMFNLNLVDTIGSGIIKMFNYQKDRLFPLPEYHLKDDKVKVTIIGKILDMDYARLLAKTPTLSLTDIILLDKVQKNKRLAINEEKHLKTQKLIEGRKPNFYVTKKIAQNTGHKAEYSKNKAFEKEKYFDWILKSIEEHGNLNRKDIDKLLWNVLPDWMDNKKRKIKINNILSELRKKGVIINKGTLSNPEWALIESNSV